MFTTFSNVVLRCCFLEAQSQKKKKKHISVRDQRLTSTVRIQQIFRTHVGLAEQFSEKYRRKISQTKKSTRHKRKSQSPNLSLRLKNHRSGEKFTPSSAAITTEKNQRVEKRIRERKKREGKTWERGKPLFLLRCCIFVSFIELTGPTLSMDITTCLTRMIDESFEHGQTVMV